jgi:hypothetical protein
MLRAGEGGSDQPRLQQAAPRWETAAKVTKRKPPHELKKRGRKSTYLAQYAQIAKRMTYLGATDRDLAFAFGVNITTVHEWKALHPEFGMALKVGKHEANTRVERSLYQKAVGYDYPAVKIFMPAGAKKPVYAPYVEHVPPDVTACIFWLKNRDPAHWRDAWLVDHTLGKYIISDRPMTEEEWIRERAVMIDVTPEKTDEGRARAGRRLFSTSIEAIADAE